MTELNKYSSPPTLFEVVRTNFKKLFILTSIILVVAVLYIFIKPRTYTATATLLFPSAGGKLAMLGGGDGDLPSLPVMEGAMLVPQTGSSNATCVTLIKSIKARKMILSKMMKRGYDLRKIWDKQRTDYLYDKMDDVMKITKGKNNELFLEAKTKVIKNDKGVKDVTLSFNYMQCVMETLDEITSELPLDPAKQGEKYLKDQIAKTYIELDDAANKLKKYQEDNLIINPDAQSKSLAEEYATVQSSTLESKIQAELAMKQLHDVSAKTEQFVKASIDPSFIVSDSSSVSTSGGTNNNVLSTLYVRITAIESDLALMKLKFRDAHPEVVNKKAELTEQKKRLQNEMKRQIGLARDGLSPGIYVTAMSALIAQAKLDGYRRAEGELKSQIEKMPGISLNYIKLQAIVTEKTNVLTMLKTEYEKAKVVAETRGPSYVMLDEPQLADEPDSRSGGKIFALAFALAMMICSVLSYLEWLKYQPVESEIK